MAYRIKREEQDRLEHINHDGGFACMECIAKMVAINLIQSDGSLPEQTDCEFCGKHDVDCCRVYFLGIQ